MEAPLLKMADSAPLAPKQHGGAWLRAPSSQRHFRPTAPSKDGGGAAFPPPPGARGPLPGAAAMAEEAARRAVAALPLLRTAAGPRDRERWAERLKEEYRALIQVRRPPGSPGTGGTGGYRGGTGESRGGDRGQIGG